MRINTNVSALNTQRQLGITNNAVSQSITKLSSGFRINRAADDAAGLGIANKLRGDIRSMTQAARNGEQANSLAQIAEGSVSGIASMLDRMKELATQANSATVDTDGRSRLDAEFQALKAEIARTASTTQFGSTKLIDGTLGNTAALTTGTYAIRTGDTGANATANSPLVAASISGTADDVYSIVFHATDGSITVSNADGSKQQVITAEDGAAGEGSQFVNFDTFGITLELDEAYRQTTTAGTYALTVTEGSVGASFMVGSSGAYAATGGTGDLLDFENVNMTTSGLGIASLNVLEVASSQSALTGLDTAISRVNEALGTIGAFQNRIENAVANLKTGIENLSASESVIRDLDMAEEMTKFSKNQILQQAGTAMLAQANSASQNILQLLRG